MTTQGSKIDLRFDPFSTEPAVANPGLLTVTIKYPVNGSNTPTVEKLLTCKGIQWRFDPDLELDVITANLDGEIHDTDQLLTTQINLPQGWASVGDEESGAVSMTLTNNSLVDYPQLIVSWDDLPHRVYPSPVLPFPPTTFTIDLAIAHAYSFPGSPFGDVQVTVFLDSISPQQVIAVPTGKVSERPGFPRYHAYRATFTTTGLLDDTNARIRFEIKPSRGDAASILTSTPYAESNTWNPARSQAQGGSGVQPNIEELRIVTKANVTGLDLAPRYAVVDEATGNDTLRGVYLTKAEARLLANRFATIEGAKASAGSTGVAGDIDNLQILMFAGRARFGPKPISQTNVPAPTVVNSTRPLVILPDDGVSRDQVEITNASFALAFNVPQEAAMSLHNISEDKTYDWRWTSTDLRIREINTLGEELLAEDFPRDQELSAIRTQINGNPNLEIQAEILNNHGSWNASREAGHFPGTTEPVAFGPNVTVEIVGQVDTFIRIDVGSMQISIGSDTTPPYSFTTYTTASALVAQIIADWQTLRGLLFDSEVIRNIPTNTLAVLAPEIMTSGQRMTFFENQSVLGIQHAYVELRNVVLRTIEVHGATASGTPAHLFMDQVKIRQETRGSGFSSPVPATAGKWLGGIWSRRGDWDTVNQCTKGWAMVRDAFFQRIGSDIGREVSYACNWIGEDINPLPGEDRHGDLFQWFPGNPLVHGNIICVNFDFRLNLGAQPFLLNPNGSGHTYRGVAFVNWRVDAALQQQISGSGDHILFWFCTILQGRDSSRKILLRAEAAGDRFHNLRVINTVCERMSLGFQTGQPSADMASLWSILHNDHIIDVNGLDDENGQVPDIEAYPACTDDESLDSLFQNFDAGDWHPKSTGRLNNRPAAVQKVYRYDAEGGDRTVILQPPIGALLV